MNSASSATDSLIVEATRYGFTVAWTVIEVPADVGSMRAAKEVDAFVSYIQHEGRGYMAQMTAKAIVNAAFRIDPLDVT